MHAADMREKRYSYKVCWENVQERDGLEDYGVDCKTVLRLGIILK
jgi:hypothetical protein